MLTKTYLPVTSHLVVPLDVPVVVSHPGFGLASRVVSGKSLGIRTGDHLKQRRSYSGGGGHTHRTVRVAGTD